jgi:anthranilate synthase component I
MLVIRSLAADTDLLALHRVAPARYPVLLESAAHGTAHGRWDLLLAAEGSCLRLGRDGNVRDQAGARLGDDFLAALDVAWSGLRLPREEPRWPFRGGWALLLGYELAAQVEPVLRLPAAPGVVPVALALRCPAAVLRDRATGECVSVAETAHAALLDAIDRDMLASRGLAPLPAWRAPASLEEDPPERYLAGVGRVREYLAAGDVFQVNLSRPLAGGRFDSAPAPADLYARLRAANPAPFAGLLAWQDWAVLSSSPERLLSVRSGLAETRPIAGTRPRLPGDALDDAARVARSWSAHPKERAEHVMLIDLERNDLGRVCEPGSVEVRRADERSRATPTSTTSSATCAGGCATAQSPRRR